MMLEEIDEWDDENFIVHVGKVLKNALNILKILDWYSIFLDETSELLKIFW